jgi:hypothetical protein
MTNNPASIADIAFDTGVIAERSRIIKLLEDPEQHDYSNYGEHYEPKCLMCQALSLIKGNDNR